MHSGPAQTAAPAEARAAVALAFTPETCIPASAHSWSDWGSSRDSNLKPARVMMNRTALRDGVR